MNISSILNSFAKVYFSLRSGEFISIPENEWDNLIVLDACRFDYFKELDEIKGDLEMRYTKGPQTPIFLRENFKGGHFHDTVYVSGNPYQKQILDDDQFHRVYHLWETHWDDDLKTVHPKDINKVALDAYDKYPNKRIIVHYMQPHMPYIGSWARKNIGIDTGNQHERQRALYGAHDIETDTPFTKLKNKSITREDVVRGYKENLKIVLHYTKELLNEFSGKSVVTSDHGEMFGERSWPIPIKLYQHPPFLVETLLQVPWLVVYDGDRREVEAEIPQEGSSSVSEESLRQKLKDLGYS